MGAGPDSSFYWLLAPPLQLQAFIMQMEFAMSKLIVLATLIVSTGAFAEVPLNDLNISVITDPALTVLGRGTYLATRNSLFLQRAEER